MKKQFLLVILLSIILCKTPYNLRSGITFINFSDGEISIVGDKDGIKVSENKITIKDSGTFLAQGSIKEANIQIKSSSVNLLLQNLEITSSTTAPIVVDDNLNDVKIINIQNSTLNDIEDPSTTEGECAVVKIKKNSKVIFDNQGDLKMNGLCKNIIKGGNNVSIIFEKSDGELIINANKTAISSDGYLEFNGGKFTIIAGGDAIKSSPDEDVAGNNGKILINDGIFDINCNNDGFTATKNLTIVNGIFNIKTENGFDSETFKSENSSAKGFKLTKNDTGNEIKIYGGEFNINSADDAFHSNADLII